MSTKSPFARFNRHLAAVTALCFALCLGQSAGASELMVRVVDDAGRPVKDAVVTLRPNGEAPPPMRVGAGYRVEQKDIQFNPFVSVVPVGASVSFPNLDPVKHHVYSFSPAKHFELKLYARDERRSVIFDRPGVVAIGCNIHDRMSAYVFVSDTVWTARSGDNGLVRFGNTPGRAFTLAVWHPYQRAPGGLTTMTLAPTAQDRSQVLTIHLRAPPMHRMDGY